VPRAKGEVTAVIEPIHEGVIRVAGLGLPPGLWRARASRKVCRCAITRQLILPPETCYGPVKTKRKGRDLRLSEAVIFLLASRTKPGALAPVAAYTPPDESKTPRRQR
jgi:hypothetical protein